VKRMDMIDGKIAQVREMINSADIRIRLMESMKQKPSHELLEFQERRLKLLLWARSASEEEIRDRLSQLEEVAGPAIALKYESMVGLPTNVAETICTIELLELAIGTHPSLQGIS
jgi:hypothetical protein